MMMRMTKMMEGQPQPPCKRACLEQLMDDDDNGNDSGSQHPAGVNSTLTSSPMSVLLGHPSCVEIGQGLELNVRSGLGFGLAQVGTASEMGSSSGAITSTGAPEEGLHPLFIPHVLDIIFTHVLKQYRAPKVAKDIQSIRLVCHIWKERATHLYRQARPPTCFGNGLYNSNEDTAGRSESLEKMRRFVDVMKSSYLIPVQSYEFQGSFFYSAGSNRAMKDFLRICGPQAVSFDFALDEFAADYLNLRDLRLDKLRTLKVRLIDLGRVEEPSETYELAYFIGSLLDGAKSLREFELEGGFLLFPSNTYSRRVHSKMLEQFERVIIRRIPTSVKVLSLSMFLTKTTFNNLMENELKLEELAIPSNCVSDFEDGTLQKFLEDQAPTLKVLKVLPPFLRDHEAAPLVLPRLGGLISLELPGPHFQPISIIDQFPKMRFLDAKYWRPENTFELFFDYAKKTAPSVRRIQMPWSVPNAPFISQDIVETLQVVFMDLRGLEILDIEIYHRVNADTLLSGIPESDWERIQKLPRFDGVNEDELGRKPSILNLTNLRKLAIRGTNYHATVTDFAAHFVFLRMADLKSLYLSDWMMSPEYIARLRQRLVLTLEDENWEPEDEETSGEESVDDSQEEEELALEEINVA